MTQNCRLSKSCTVNDGTRVRLTGLSVSAGKLLIASVAVCALANCDRSINSEASAGASRDVQRLDSVTWTVLSTDVGRAAVRPCTRSKPRGVTRFWRPSPQTINDIEARLPHVMDSVFRRLSEKYREYPDRNAYYRQYIGITRWN